MQFTLGTIFIEDLQFGPRTEVKDKTLYVNKEELTQLLLQDEHLQSVSIEIAHPGESVRIMPVKDVIEPRVKPDQEGASSRIGEQDVSSRCRPHPCAQGRERGHHRPDRGLPRGHHRYAGTRRRADPFSQLHNLVIVAEPVAGVTPHQHEAALRKMGLRAANYLGKRRALTPDETATYELLPLHEYHRRYPDLPKVAYVYMLQSQGLLHDTYYYGVDVKTWCPPSCSQRK